MKIYKVSQEQNSGYDTYDSFICCAESEMDAANTSPDGFGWNRKYSGTWCSTPEQATVEKLGDYTGSESNGTILLASFNAG